MIEPSNFKSYDELQTHLFSVLEESTAPSAPVQQETEKQDEPKSEKSEFDDYFSSSSNDNDGAPSSVNTDDDDDLESYFKNLAAD